jgi:hypothetical protein
MIAGPIFILNIFVKIEIYGGQEYKLKVKFRLSAV